MRLKLFIFYAVYGLASFFVFLIMLFPKERITHILSENINSGFTDGQISIEAVVPVFPPGLKAVNPSILFNNGNKIKMESIAIYPEILSFYNDVKKIGLKAEVYGGKIDGTLELGRSLRSSSRQSVSSKQSSSPHQAESSHRVESSHQNRESKQHQSKPQNKSSYDVAVVLHFSDMDIRDLKHSAGNFNIISSFIMNGELNYRISIDNTAAGTAIGEGSGSGAISLSRCKLRSDNIFLKQMGIGEVSLTNIDIEWNRSQNILSIANLNAAGSDMKIKLKGDMFLKTPTDYSTLDLKGTFQLSSDGISSIAESTSGLATLTRLFSGSAKRGISFTITGTLQNPIVTPIL